MNKKTVKFIILCAAGLGLTVANYFIGKKAGETLAEIIIEKRAEELPEE